MMLIFDEHEDDVDDQRQLLELKNKKSISILRSIRYIPLGGCNVGGRIFIPEAVAFDG
jgi:hypothetical protein